MKEASSIIFKTERLIVRNLVPADFTEFHKMQANQKVMQHTTGIAQTEEQDRESLKKCISAYSEPKNDFWVWAIERKSDGAFVGTCAIVDEKNEIGYRFQENWWGNGYGQEILKGLIAHAFLAMGLDRLEAHVNVENFPSVVILDRSPFRFVKEYFHEEEKCDVRFYELHRTEWMGG